MMLDFESELKERTDSQKSAPKGRGRPKGSTNSATRKSKLGNIRGDIETLLTVGNAVICNAYVKLQPYGLQPEEITQLRDALVVEIESNVKLQQMLSKIGAVSPHFALATVVANITFSRYALYQAMKQMRPPVTVDPKDTDYANRNGNAPYTAPVPVATGAAHSDSGGYGERENPARVRDFEP